MIDEDMIADAEVRWIRGWVRQESEALSYNRIARVEKGGFSFDYGAVVTRDNDLDCWRIFVHENGSMFYLSEDITRDAAEEQAEEAVRTRAYIRFPPRHEVLHP